MFTEHHVIPFITYYKIKVVRNKKWI